MSGCVTQKLLRIAPYEIRRRTFFLKGYVSPRDDCDLPVGPVPRPCSYYSEKVFLFDSNGQQWPPWRGAWCCYFRRIVLLCVGWPAARPEVSCSYPSIVHIGCDKRPRASLIFLIDPLHSQWVKKVVRAVLRPLNDKPGRFDIDFYNTRPGLSRVFPQKNLQLYPRHSFYLWNRISRKLVPAKRKYQSTVISEIKLTRKFCQTQLNFVFWWIIFFLSIPYIIYSLPPVSVKFVIFIT